MIESDIIVVGAGAAGIAAARWLQAHGRSATLLEARARVGGRAWTDTRTFGFPIDFGCAWLHSGDVNPWTGIARESGFTLIERLPVWQRRIGREEATPEYHAAWRAAYARNSGLIAEAAAAGRDVPVADLVPNDEFRPLFDAVMTWAMGADSNRVSSIDYARYVDTGVNWAVREGLGAVIAHAARGLDVRLQTEVHTIDWSGKRVRLHTSRGTLVTPAAIVTLPTMVLADERTLRFAPKLPDSLTDAFAGVPLGVANKAFIELQPGALPYEESVHIVGTDKTARTGSYQTRPAGQPVLLAYFGGSLALELEQHGELESFAREQLVEIFGADFPKQIRRTAVTAWAGDPYARGSYSVALPGKAHLRGRLSEAVAGRLFFAGEAGSLESFGTLHGAWQSGVTAARAVLRTTAST